MKKVIQILVIIVSSIFLTAATESVRQISWDDLIPANLAKEDYLAGLTEDQKDLVMWFINAYEFLPKRGKDTEQSWKEFDDAMPTLKKHGIDIAKVMEKRREIRTAVVKDLHGMLVRLPGYILERF